MLKKLFPVFVIVLAATAVFAGCSKQDSSAGMAATSDQNQPAAPAVMQKLVVTAPDGWTANKNNPNVMMKGPSSYIISTDSMPGNANTPDTYVDFAKSQFQKNFKNVAFGPVSSLSVSGNEARRLEWSCQVSGIDFSYIYLYVFNTGHAYTLTCASMKSDLPKMKPDFESIIASAKLE